MGCLGEEPKVRKWTSADLGRSKSGKMEGKGL